MLSGSVSVLALAIAILALIRYDVVKLFKPLLTDVSLESTGKIEIGFSNYGPTISIPGSLIAKRSESFVVWIDAIVTSPTGAKNSLSWVFKSPLSYNFLDGETDLSSFGESACPIYVTPGIGSHGVFTFSDVNVWQGINEPLFAVTEKINRHVEEIISKEDNQNAAQTSLAALQSRVFTQAIADMGEAELLSILQKIESKMFWEAGLNVIEFSITTKHPSKTCLQSHSVYISDEDIVQLRRNTRQVLLSALGRPARFDKVTKKLV